MTNTMKRRICW